jgi:nitric oxide dioxygenase
MTPEQLDLVEWSVAALGPRLDVAVATFYARLFELDPTASALFSGDLDEQRAKFTGELTVIVGTIRQHRRFAAVAHELGDHHRALGVRAAHYRVAGTALMDAFAGTLGDEWTPELADSWRHAYRLTAEVMMAGDGPSPS